MVVTFVALRKGRPPDSLDAGVCRFERLLPGETVGVLDPAPGAAVSVFHAARLAYLSLASRRVRVNRGSLWPLRPPALDGFRRPDWWTVWVKLVQWVGVTPSARGGVEPHQDRVPFGREFSRVAIIMWRATDMLFVVVHRMHIGRRGEPHVRDPVERAEVIRGERAEACGYARLGASAEIRRPARLLPFAGPFCARRPAAPRRMGPAGGSSSLAFISPRRSIQHLLGPQSRTGGPPLRHYRPKGRV